MSDFDKNQKDIFMQSKKPPKKQKETLQQGLQLENKEKEKEFVEKVVKVVSHFGIFPIYVFSRMIRD